ncbi:Electron transport complex protein RnfG [hydrothermal vent metagenome]|uniref:Electron transport complex protein RnfG n=1 Tax=hydrothermal vent metagenome TaxID=652676 RepID=A0A3B0X1M4_9ZZZZ
MLSKSIKNILITSTLLMLFAALGAALVGLAFMQTEDDIKHNEKLTLLRKLNNIIPAESYNNDLLQDTTVINASTLLGTKEETLVYRARKNNQNIAVVFSSIAPNGYNGPIHLLVGVQANGTLAGVRVVKHRETPGLGDVVDISHSNWILGFNNKSLNNPNDRGWKVKRDGGIFDQFTGATITPRAVVKAVHNALLYFKQNQQTLFNKPVAVNTETKKLLKKDHDGR